MTNVSRSPQTKLLTAIYGRWLRDEDLYQSVNGITLRAALEEALNSTRLAVSLCLDERNKQVVLCRFGWLDGQCRSLIDVGKEFNITRERVRQIEGKALRRLFHHSRSNKLRPYIKHR